jgi:class 3 adenylate cyclase
MSGPSDTEPTIEELLDRAVEAANRGDIVTMQRLAGEVLAEDATNAEADELLTSPVAGSGELRRASIMFCDLVGSTELSGRQDPERYRGMIRRYKDECLAIIEARYDGHVVGAKGDGLLSLFGIPRAHGNDVERAIRAGLDIVAAVHQLSDATEQAVGERLDVRVAVHRGMVYIDPDDDDIYGLAVNVAARLEGLAEPGTVVVSEEVRALAEGTFELTAQPAQAVKGVSEPLHPYRVDGERPLPRAPRPGSTVVGRAAELGRLDELWQEVRDQRGDGPVSILLRGEAGIGKTCLAAVMADRARKDGAAVVEISGSSFHVDTGFHPVRSLMERRAERSADDDAGERLEHVRGDLTTLGLDAERLVPLLAPVLGVQPAAGYVPAASDARKLHEEVSNAAEEYVLACLAPGPALLIADDLQWFDDSTRALLQRIATRTDTPLLVVMTARPEAPAPAGVEVLEIGPLSRLESRVLLDVLGAGDLESTDLRALAERGDGVPLYLEELARAAVDPRAADATAPARDANAPASPPGATHGPVPDVLYELLVALLYAKPEVAPVAGAAAVFGRELDHSLLAEVLDISDAELAPAIETLLEEQVLTRETADRSRFRHGLLRDVAYELQPPSQRRLLHARIGDVLVRRHAANEVVDWALVAHHFVQAGRRVAAADAYEHAADDARRRGALDEARRDLGAAIESIDGLPAGDARDRREVELRLRRGFLAASTEGNASSSAAADYGRCLHLAGVDAADEEMFRTLIVLWAYFVGKGELERAHQVLSVLRPVLTGEREFWTIFNTAGFGMLDWFGGSFDRASDQLEEAGAEVDLVGRDDEVESSWLNPMDPKVSIHTHLALARFVRGDFEGADHQLDEAARGAAGLPFPQGPFSTAYLLSFMGWMRMEVGDYDAADDVVARLTDLAAEHGFDSWTLIAVTENTTANALRARDADVADPAALTGHAAMMEGFIAAWSQFDIKLMLPFYWTSLGTVVAATGDADAARSHFASSLALAESTGMHFYDAETRRRAAGLAGDPAAVREGLLEAMATAKAQGAHLFELRAALDLYRLDPAGFTSDLDAATKHFAGDARCRDVAEARAAVAARG